MLLSGCVPDTSDFNTMQANQTFDMIITPPFAKSNNCFVILTSHSLPVLQSIPNLPTPRRQKVSDDRHDAPRGRIKTIQQRRRFPLDSPEALDRLVENVCSTEIRSRQREHRKLCRERRIFISNSGCPKLERAFVGGSLLPPPPSLLALHSAIHPHSSERRD